MSSPGFGNDSQMMVMRVDVTAQATPELTTPNEVLYLAVTAKKETDRAQHETCLAHLFSHWYDSFKADRVQTPDA
ncbi:hypothetical protein TNCV_3242571 [Trichonephila clavipes]|nr:hypothetical protein TNCV_3242571 [Trichonephila clavipes]